MKDLESQVLEVVRRNLPGPMQAGLEMDTKIFERGLDSLGLFTLVGDIEKTFAIRLADEDMNDSTFATARTILKLITETQKSSQKLAS
jgi:acyl carrier protein